MRIKISSSPSEIVLMIIIHKEICTHIISIANMLAYLDTRFRNEVKTF
jgi:hypothetical protein